jgi:ubiquinone/menaquinone biosynthesis C-methylase UbiE
MKRVPSIELLDNDEGTPGEISASLSDLRNINHWFGGIGTSESMIRKVARASKQRKLSLLEVASGLGDLPKAVQQRTRRHGLELDITFSDRSASHLNQGTRAVAADVLSLPFADDSFDVVHSALFMHHLAPEEVVACVRESLRVCRTAVLINDVVRDRLHLMLVYAGLPLFRSRLTHNDAPASVRQAYTVAEMHQLLRIIPRATVQISTHFMFRMGVIVWKREQTHV